VPVGRSTMLNHARVAGFLSYGCVGSAIRISGRRVAPMFVIRLRQAALDEDSPVNRRGKGVERVRGSSTLA
jgi:hypothetical protein